MIIQSPESAMPEPYKTYVRQRSEIIASVLGKVVGYNNVQLCPRAITIDEQTFPTDEGIIYGAIVKKPIDGYKSVLYSTKFSNNGIATLSSDVAESYVVQQVRKGNRVRVKDPRESDGQGQHTVETVAEMLPFFQEITSGSNFGCVLMPHLEKIRHRISVGQIDLGEIGNFTYLGREETTFHEGNEVYGGTILGLYSSSQERCEENVSQYFDIPPALTDLGKRAIKKYSNLALKCGRVSFDVVEGITDGGDIVRDVIDVTPRVGGATPAETLALREIHLDLGSLCFASSKLIYNPVTSPNSGVNFIDTDTLVINAQIHEVIK